MRAFLVVLGALAALLPSAAAASPALIKARSQERNGIVKITSVEQFDELVNGRHPRDYSLTVLLTAMAPNFKCTPCHTFDPEHKLVAKQWSKQQKKHSDVQHVFASIDFNDGQAIFQRMGLSSAPVVKLYHPQAGSRKKQGNEPESLDFQRAGFAAEGFASYLKGVGGVPIEFVRPVDQTKVFLTVVFVAGVLAAAIFAWPLVKSILTEWRLWALFCITLILMMTSGYMWNQIRKPPYAQPTRNGVTYITGGYSNQLGAETHIMSALYGLLAFSAYALTHILPQVDDRMRQKVGIYIWAGIHVLLLGVVLSIFRVKQGGYPFKILF